jgi:hypothetical protein
VTVAQTKGGLNMRTTGFDKASMDRVIRESLIEKIEAVSCPKCHKIATPSEAGIPTITNN